MKRKMKWAGLLAAAVATFFLGAAAKGRSRSSAWAWSSASSLEVLTEYKRLHADTNPGVRDL